MSVEGIAIDGKECYDIAKDHCRDDGCEVELDDDKDDDESSSSSSMDANDALLEMLGLTVNEGTSREADIDDETSHDDKVLINTERMCNILSSEEEEVLQSATNTANVPPVRLSPQSSIRQFLMGASPRPNLEITPFNQWLPRHCSRHQVSPSQCLAFSILNFLSLDECQALIDLSHQSNPKYITQASHVAPDGTHYTVPIQKPNPHKLAVMESPYIINSLWTRLRPLIIGSTSTQGNKGNPLSQSGKRWGPYRGLNPRIRILRYDANDGDLFEPHFDATTVVGRHTSAWTVLIYLNNGSERDDERSGVGVETDTRSDGLEFQGGETCFLNSGTFMTASQVAEVATSETTMNNKHLSSTAKEMYRIAPKAGQAVIFEHDLVHTGLPLISGTKYVLRTDVLFDTNHLEMVEEKENSDDEDAGDSSNNSSPVPQQATIQTVGDLCKELNLNSSEINVLIDMGVYQMTLQAFLLPGITVLTSLLSDSTLTESSIKMLVKRATEILN
jgi:hypothetical protein